jgi:hypothetical protein
MEIKARTHILCLVFLLLAGCATHSEIWEKAGGGSQHIFDLDSRECAYIANQVALQQSETGKKADPAFFSQAYSECLDAKGWHRKPAAAEPEPEIMPDTVQQLAEVITPTTVKGFAQTITVPDTYKMLSHKRMQSGPTLLEQFFWQGQDGSFINILFQENLSTTFEKQPYPVIEPYMLYTSGEGEKAGEKLQWATFFGQTDSNWVMINGAYYYVSKKERIIIVITKSLDQPSGAIPEDAALARNQYLQIEAFSEQWQRWLNQQFKHGPGLLKQLMRGVKYGM